MKIEIRLTKAQIKQAVREYVANNSNLAYTDVDDSTVYLNSDSAVVECKRK